MHQHNIDLSDGTHNLGGDMRQETERTGGHAAVSERLHGVGVEEEKEGQKGGGVNQGAYE